MGSGMGVAVGGSGGGLGESRVGEVDVQEARIRLMLRRET